MYLSLLRLNPASAAVQRDLRDVTGLHRTIMKAYPDVLDPEEAARAHFLPEGYLYPEEGIPNPSRKVDTKSGPDGRRRNGRRVPLRGPEEQIDWLARKGAQCGFALLQATIAASGAAELVKSSSTGRTFQGVLFEGRLVVQDPQRFQEVLTTGIGPGKAFGFGLLSVGPD